MLFLFVSQLLSTHCILRFQYSFLLIETYGFVRFNLDRLNMRKNSYDLNHEEARYNRETDELKTSRRGSRIYGTANGSSSRYISDRYHCSLCL
jgi:hypothetical protein